MATVSSDSCPKPTSRREAQRAAGRHAILDAAERIFAERGFPGATIAEIARTAGFAVGSIYNFFPGKSELAEAVMLRIATERVEEVERDVLPLAGAPDFAGLRALAKVWVRHHATHGAFLRMGMDYQRSKGHREPPERFIALFRAYREATTKVFEEGLRHGYYRNLPADDLARAFEGIAHENLFEWLRTVREAKAAGKEAPAPAVLEERLARVLEALLSA